MRFERDKEKAKANLEKHGVDFDEAMQVFHEPSAVVRSDRDGESRWKAIGELEGHVSTIVFTRRADTLRIISARRAGKNEKEHIVTRRRGERRKGKTDWARVEATTDADITAAIADDPDWQDFKDVDWSEAVLVVAPKKAAISIRLDEDVLEFFKRAGAGYQRRINAVLRSYVEQMRKPPTRKQRA